MPTLKTMIAGVEYGVVHLQGIGKVPAKQAGNIKEGDVVLWNYGYRSLVTGVKETGKKSVSISFENERGLKPDSRTFYKTTLLGFSQKPWKVG